MAASVLGLLRFFALTVGSWPSTTETNTSRAHHLQAAVDTFPEMKKQLPLTDAASRPLRADSAAASVQCRLFFSFYPYFLALDVTQVSCHKLKGVGAIQYMSQIARSLESEKWAWILVFRLCLCLSFPIINKKIRLVLFGQAVVADIYKMATVFLLLSSEITKEPIWLQRN